MQKCLFFGYNNLTLDLVMMLLFKKRRKTKLKQKIKKLVNLFVKRLCEVAFMVYDQSGKVQQFKF